MKKRDNKVKEIVTVLVILAILIGSLLLIIRVNSESNLTGSIVAGKTFCQSPTAALKSINEKGCVRIYEDPKCEANGRVEISC